MIILCNMKKSLWEQMRKMPLFGQEIMDERGFLHCSTAETFRLVAPRFRNEKDEQVILCVETDKLKAPVRWEDLKRKGREYPHIYGLINIDAVVRVLPYLKDKDGNWIKNEELTD